MEVRSDKGAFIVYPDSVGTFARYFPEPGNPNELAYVGEYSSGVINVSTQIYTLPEFPGDFSPQQLRMWMTRIRALARTLESTGVALAGILPSRFFGVVSIESPCVDGIKGTSYAVTSTLRRVLSRYNLSLVTAPIRVVGIGRTGWPYISLLRELGCRDLIGIDPRFAREHRRRGILFTNRLEAIQKGDIVVFLAGGGYEINVRQLPKIIAVNDMYPRFSDDQIASMNNTGTVVYEVALRAKGVESNIPIGDFDLDEIPGCLAQALVHATGLDTASMSQQEFDQNAAQLGILSRY